MASKGIEFTFKIKRRRDGALQIDGGHSDPGHSAGFLCSVTATDDVALGTAVAAVHRTLLIASRRLPIIGEKKR